MVTRRKGPTGGRPEDSALTEPGFASDDMTDVHAPEFAAESSSGRVLGGDRYRGRVPVALSFCHEVDQQSQLASVRALSDSLEQFGHRRVQLLVVVPWSASDTRAIAESEAFQVPLLSDPADELRESFHLSNDPSDPTTVIIDVHGDIAAVVHQEPGAPHPEAVLTRVDILKEQHPERMAPLPHSHMLHDDSGS